VEAGRLLQAKGCSYTLAALLGDARAAEPFYEGHYITLYLSPRDYHRIHMPVNGTVTRWRYIPGSLYPVNVSGVTHIDGLFTKNERLISFIESDRGSLAMVKVGATIVGSIRTPYGPAYAKPRQRQRHGILEGRPQLRLSRGEEVGYFEFGSTVILVMAPTVVSSFAVRAGDTVKMGETLAHLNPSIGVPMSE
jgi:phosphatidylserine decarboxylase